MHKYELIGIDHRVLYAWHLTLPVAKVFEHALDEHIMNVHWKKAFYLGVSVVGP
jgi:hypothetical protein